MLRRAAALLSLPLAALAFAQAQTARPGGDDAAAATLKRRALISDLQFLASVYKGASDYKGAFERLTREPNG